MVEASWSLEWEEKNFGEIWFRRPPPNHIEYGWIRFREVKAGLRCYLQGSVRTCTFVSSWKKSHTLPYPRKWFPPKCHRFSLLKAIVSGYEAWKKSFGCWGLEAGSEVGELREISFFEHARCQVLHVYYLSCNMYNGDTNSSTWKGLL